VKFTLCFLTRGDGVLMLCRRRPPNQGLWNGVGGRIEPGETPLASCLREVREETGFSIDSARFSALVSWTGFETPDGALAVFTALAPSGEPVPCDEGELAWRPRGWVLSSPDVVSNIHRYGPEVFAGLPPRWHRFTYSSGAIASHEIFALPAPVDAYA
jgi:8-oxo-dGTP diphosphatase